MVVIQLGILRDIKIDIRIVPVLVLPEDRSVWHLLTGDVQQVSALLIVLVIVRVSDGKFRKELQTGGHGILQVHPVGKAVQLLPDDGTRLLVVSERSPELRLFTSSADRKVMVVRKAVFGNLIHPIRIVVEVLEVLGCPVRIHKLRLVVTIFRDIAIFLVPVEVSLLHQHRIIVAIQQFGAFRLLRPRETVRITHPCRSRHTLLRRNINHTIGSARPPDSCCRTVLQHRNLFYIVRTDAQ